MLALILGMDPASFATVVGTVITILTIVAAIVYRTFAVQGLSGQLAAKDAVIATNVQTISAFEQRIEGLELKTDELALALKASEIEVKQLKVDNLELKRHTAPEVLPRIESRLDHIDTGQDRIDHRLERIEDSVKKT